jgi:hypothetical protein
MPVYQKLVNFDLLYLQLNKSAIIVNDFVNIDEDDKTRIKNMIISEYSSDMISTIPTCDCNEVKGEYNLGVICKHCNTPVKAIIEDSIEPILWFRRPKGVAKLINPTVWMLLCNKFKKSGFSIIHWIADSTYKATVKQPPIIDKLILDGIPRGYNSFVDNFDYIMEYLFKIKDFINRKEKTNYLKKLIDENRSIIFSDYLALPNKALLILEKGNTGTYMDFNIPKAMDAIQMITSIDFAIMDHSPKVKENRTIKAISKLSEYYATHISNSISGKTGQLIKHVFGTRTNFNFRAVISSITDKHKYDEVYVPWSIGMTAFRPHVINKLMRRGYDLNSSIAIISGHVERYNPMLDEILNELIDESPHKGIVIIEHRNPTLLSGSAQTKKITRFKTDIGDHTVSTSILTVKAPNSDYDGDALNYSIALDNYLGDLWSTLEPHNNIFLINSPNEISDNISIPKPVISTMSSWLSSSEHVDNNKLELMRQYFKE